MKLVHNEENKSVVITLNGQVLTVRAFAGDSEITGWNCDYEAEGFGPNYAADAYEYEIKRYERIGYTKL
ncbi:hypothetical protein ACIRO1_36460 [Streptomyces sp. NPDC102381]|uniref:hypothetical protein n=1 Tax=Streptomyces sp. NPDC102381 TaxID=3366164 RepID=UPI003811A506